MKMIFEVRRNRPSVTQGSATVILNGQEVITFADNIEIAKPARSAEYGENIDGWQSTKADAEFIKGVLFPFYTNAEKISTRIKEIIK